MKGKGLACADVQLLPSLGEGLGWRFGVCGVDGFGAFGVSGVLHRS